MAKRIPIRDVATGRVVLVEPIDAAEWIASGAGKPVSDADSAEPAKGRAKRGGRAAKKDAAQTPDAAE